MIRSVPFLAVLATFTLQNAPARDPCARVAALDHQRLQQTGIVMDNELRDVTVRELFAPGAKR